MKVFMSLDKLLNYQEELRQQFPDLYICLPCGISSLMDCILHLYMCEERTVDSFMEECINVIDAHITDECESNGKLVDYANSATEQLFSYQFQFYIASLWEYVCKQFESVFKEDKYVVTDYDTFDKLTKIFLTIEFDVPEYTDNSI